MLKEVVIRRFFEVCYIYTSFTQDAGYVVI